ncbi:MAG: hypothetical protein AB7E80_09340 [Hyphomicrobiaceae bacterium]
MSRVAVVLLVLVSAALLFVAALPQFVGSDYLPAARDITAALLGAFITVSVTAVLLRYQTASEVNRDKSVAVFQEKLRLYEGFCTFLADISSSRSLKQADEQAMRAWAMRLSLVSGTEVSEAIDHFFVQTHRYRTLFYESLSQEQRRDLPAWHADFYRRGDGSKPAAECFMSIGTLVAHLKHDLGEIEISSLRDVASARHAVDDIVRVQAASSETTAEG